MSSSVVVQTVQGWGGWPDDVRDRLRGWNTEGLLSFRRGPSFICAECGRDILSHPYGNCVVRPRRKAHGVTMCEDCLVELSRAYVKPPDRLAPRSIEYRLRKRISLLERALQRKREQTRIDADYIDRLQELVDPAALAELHAELRGKHRRPA